MRRFPALLLSIFAVLSPNILRAETCHKSLKSNFNNKIKYLKSYSASDIRDIMPSLARVAGNDGAHVYRVSYEVEDRNGKTLSLSGLMLTASSCKKKAPLIVYHHGTITTNSSAPSVAGNYGLIEASHGYNVLVPDYFGYGNSSRSLHPYLIEDYYGISSKGMLDVYRELQTASADVIGKLFISGYSEGGYGALATVKYLESNPEFNYTVEASAPAAGPYDLLSTGLDLLQYDSTNPLNTAFLISAYSSYYPKEIDSGKILKKIEGVDYSKIFNEDISYEQLLTKLPSSVDDLLYSDFRDGFLHDAANYIKNKSYPASNFVKKLNKNSIHCNWKPKSNMKFFHCEDDHTVPDLSSKKAYECLSKLSDKVELEIIKSPKNQKPYDHYSCPALFTPIFYFNTYR